MKKIVLFLSIVLIGFGLISTCNSNSSTSDENSEITNDQWYKGGSLHKAKIIDWKNATEENKLATCSDFMATVDNTVSMTELKKRSTELKNCIDESTRGIDKVNNESVASIAAMCKITMGY